MWKFSKAKGQRTTLISCLDCGRSAYLLYFDAPYLFECGVSCRLFLLGSFHNLRLDKRKSTPHFLVFILTYHKELNGMLPVDGTIHTNI